MRCEDILKRVSSCDLGLVASRGDMETYAKLSVLSRFESLPSRSHWPFDILLR